LAPAPGRRSAPRRLPPRAAAPPDGAAAADADEGWLSWADAPGVKPVTDAAEPADGSAAAGLQALAAALAGDVPSAEAEAAAHAAAAAEAAGVERAFLVAVAPKSGAHSARAGEYSTSDSLGELAALCATAGLAVAGRDWQALPSPNPRTYVNTGFLAELGAKAAAAGAGVIVFDDELSPAQIRALEAALPGLRLCDRTTLILDVFSQRARSREGALQVELAAAEYQLPRLTRLWSHLERQGGGRTKGMGEKQKEIDRRLLKSRISALKKTIDDVRRDRAAHRARRADAGLPVVALVGYTSAGKSSLLNALTGAGVLADDALFATLDPTTRRLTLPSGKAALLTDTVGFIRKLPTSLVAAFRATLEEAAAADVLVHVVDVAHPAAAAQSATVASVLADVGAGDAHGQQVLTVWNKVDAAADPGAVADVAAARARTVAVSAATGAGLGALLSAVEAVVAAALTPVTALVPFAAGGLVAAARAEGVVEAEAFVPAGALLRARVPPALAARLAEYAVDDFDAMMEAAAEAAAA